MFWPRIPNVFDFLPRRHTADDASAVLTRCAPELVTDRSEEQLLLGVESAGRSVW
jgi:hypothetical protein